ncbi:glycosyltransferase [Marinimicrobium alkaliphilum]|uniref:glycosyltransferase n=1 Tax=Marinimicrobium alkaliphilum TaxID=2202654 RepID=UPI000DBA0157|nr:glycosyltransferase [Marinimicrobium alkaliphilum]
MTIRNIERKGLLGIGVDKGVMPPVTIAFAFDRGYLECFKVMLVSLLRSKTLLDCPIAIYSDDPEVFKDSVVRLVADKKVLLDGRRRDVIYDLAKNNVKRQERAAWNKGTFLKWSVFEEQDTDLLLFLDVDMLALSKLEPLVKLGSGSSMVACPQFQNYLRKDRTEMEVDTNLSAMLDGEFDERHGWRINSGMMLIGKEFLSGNFFNEVTDFAKQKVDLHEQAHLSNYFKQQTSRLKMVSSRYNFQEEYLWKASISKQRELLQDISVLHYAGSRKPWRANPRPTDRASTLLWHGYRSYAEPVLRFSESRPRAVVRWVRGKLA